MKKYIFILLLGLIFTNSNFSLKNNNLTSSIYEFNIGEIQFDNNRISLDSRGTTQEVGAPELPTYSFNYSIQNNKNYEVEYVVNAFEIYENIIVEPAQPLQVAGEEKQFVKNDLLYSSFQQYPENNLNVNRMSLRGYELLNIEIIPFEYNFQTKQLKVYHNIDIMINEISDREEFLEVPRSRTFESIYKNYVINADTYQDSRSFQKPAILYICGGNLETSSYFDELVNWRKQQGYIVYTASLSDTGSSTGSIKNYLENAYDNWENPPEFVCFIGDANGSVYVPTYTVSGGSGWGGPAAQGEGDYPYSLLDGNDFLPELILGRISVRSTSEFVTIKNKIIGYEKNYANDSDWLNRISLVGDPYDSGISTVITNEYIEQLVELHGGINFIDRKYSGNNYDDWMRDAINGGTAYLNYRGFYGFSGFTSNDVNQLNNGYKLPFIATLTCGTGSFATETTSMTESLFRAGTSVSPKGAVAIVGTAQSYTHTAFNNIIDMGIFDGIFLHNSRTVGEAVAYGYLAMNEIYPQNPGDNVYLFNTWNSLLGDPLTHLWTSPPKTLNVQHAPMLINGSTNFQVNVTDDSGDAVEGVSVTLINSNYDTDDLFMTSYTDINGIADFTIENIQEDDNIIITSRAQNYLPEESTLILSNSLPEVTLVSNSVIINDTNGNNDQIWNPGEEVSLSFDIYNNSNSLINNLYLTVSSNSDLVIVETLEQSVGSLSPYSFETISDITVSIPSNIASNVNPNLKVELYSSSDDLLWNYNLPVDFRFGEISLSYIISNDDNNNGLLERGESGDLRLLATNVGSILLEDLLVELDYIGNQFSLSGDAFNFSNLNINASSQSDNSITIQANNDIINGSLISLPLYATSINGYESEAVITIQVGQVSVTDPLGPDNYGYYIYDMNDNDYELSPDYEWIEIDPDYGGDGSEINLNDSGDNQDDVTTINLPFTFTFYGQDYSTVSVCSNGWISFGDTDMRSFRNYTLPGPGGPSPIVAVFWDDLKTTSGGEVYQYYDEANNAFIIEWSNLRTFFANSTESFQIILYDTGWQTPTGDDEMKLQYKEFNNTSVGDYPVGNYDGAVIHGQYCTVGIENHLMNDGLQYTFNNTYPTAAMPLSDQTAIFITTRSSELFAQPQANYNESEFLFSMPVSEQDTDELIITNDGEPGSVLVYSTAVSPFQSNISQIDDFGYAWESSGNTTTEFSWIDISDDNEILSFESNDTGTLIDLDFSFPFYGDNYFQCFINPNGWIGFEEDNDGWNNQSIYDEDAPRSAIFAFWDDLNPTNAGNDVGSGFVKYHSNSERVVIWFDRVVHWTSLERVYDFQIILYPSGKIDLNYREMTGDLGSATIGIIDQEGIYGLEIVYNDNFVEDELSLTFDLVPSWLNLNLLSGNISQIPFGESAIYSLNVNTNDLNNGSYTAYIVVSTNASTQSDVIPVDLYVSENLQQGDINQDGIIDILDAVRMVSIIMGDYNPSNIELLLSDMNEDEVINIQDIVLLVNLILSN